MKEFPRVKVMGRKELERRLLATLEGGEVSRGGTGTYKTVTARFWPWISGKRH